MNRSRPGFAFSIICDLGFAVGIVTHYVEKVGDLVWLAKPLFDEQPGIDQVKSISEWRWPVLFPVDAAVLHTHPSALPNASVLGGPSAADVATLQALGQDNSILLERGSQTVFDSEGHILQWQ